MNKIARNEKNGMFTINTAKDAIESKYVIVTGTPATISKIEFQPLLDHNNIQLLQRIPMGQSMKFFVIYETGLS